MVTDEIEERGDEILLKPFYWRNDFAGVEQYSITRERNRILINWRTLREHENFAQMWNQNLEEQGYIAAFQSAQSGKAEDHEKS